MHTGCGMFHVTEYRGDVDRHCSVFSVLEQSGLIQQQDYSTNTIQQITDQMLYQYITEHIGIFITNHDQRQRLMALPEPADLRGTIEAQLYAPAY